MKSLYGILTIILNCCNISYSAIQKDCLLETPFPDYTSIFLFFSFPIAGLHKRRIFVTLYPEFKVNRL